MIEPLPKTVNGTSITFERNARKLAAERDWRAVCALVDARDEGQCRVCGKRGNPYATTLLERMHRHHLSFRSVGGVNTTANVLSLCAWCHDAVHVLRTLQLEGDADLRDTIGRLCGVKVERLREGGWEVEGMV